MPKSLRKDSPPEIKKIQEKQMKPEEKPKEMPVQHLTPFYPASLLNNGNNVPKPYSVLPPIEVPEFLSMRSVPLKNLSSQNSTSLEQNNFAVPCSPPPTFRCTRDETRNSQDISPISALRRQWSQVKSLPRSSTPSMDLADSQVWQEPFRCCSISSINQPIKFISCFFLFP